MVLRIGGRAIEHKNNGKGIGKNQLMFTKDRDVVKVLGRFVTFGRELKESDVPVAWLTFVQGNETSDQLRWCCWPEAVRIGRWRGRRGW